MVVLHAVPGLVGYPKDRFPHDAALLMVLLCFQERLIEVDGRGDAGELEHLISAELVIWINSFVKNGFSHCYHLDESIFNFIFQ